MTHGIPACVLCGSETAERVMAIVEWIEPIGHEQWSHVARCADRVDCRRTVELVIGEPWPVDDRTPAPSQPLTPAEPPAPHLEEPASEEEISWLR